MNKGYIREGYGGEMDKVKGERREETVMLMDRKIIRSVMLETGVREEGKNKRGGYKDKGRTE